VEDLAVPDLRLPDLRMLDLVPPTDLTDCVMPTIASTVGPGPNLAITLSDVRLNGGGNTARIAPGASFSLRADWSIRDNGCCIDQIIVGVAPSNPQACLMSRQVPNPGLTGTDTVTLTAPTAPGGVHAAFPLRPGVQLRPRLVDGERRAYVRGRLRRDLRAMRRVRNTSGNAAGAGDGENEQPPVLVGSLAGGSGCGATPSVSCLSFTL
jgi:hypothetical protein